MDTNTNTYLVFVNLLIDDKKKMQIARYEYQSTVTPRKQEQELLAK